MTYPEPTPEQVKRSSSAASEATKELKRVTEYLGPEHELGRKADRLKEKVDALANELYEEWRERSEEEDDE